jgi:meiotically up-regulated gene 157 (Mug157) protein
LFTKEEVATLAGKSARVMNRLWEVAMAHNGMTQKDADELAGE